MIIIFGTNIVNYKHNNRYPKEYFYLKKIIAFRKNEFKNRD